MPIQLHWPPPYRQSDPTNAITPTPIPTINICPAGWRLPTGELTILNNAISDAIALSGAGLISAPWLGQRAGNWDGSFGYQGSYGSYRSSTIFSNTQARYLNYGLNEARTAHTGVGKLSARAIRCVAQ